MDAEGFVEMADQKPNWPKEFEAEPNEEVERDAADPHQKEFQVDQVVRAKEPKVRIITEKGEGSHPVKPAEINRFPKTCVAGLCCPPEFRRNIHCTISFHVQFKVWSKRKMIGIKQKSVNSMRPNVKRKGDNKRKPRNRLVFNIHTHIHSFGSFREEGKEGEQLAGDGFPRKVKNIK